MSEETKHTTHCRARQRWGDGECECEVRMLSKAAAVALDEASLRRTGACVGACAGIPTEALEAGALAKALDALADVHRGIYWNDDPAAGMVGAWWHGKTDTAELHGRMLAALRALGRLP